MLFHRCNLFVTFFLLHLSICTAVLLIACGVRDISLGHDPGKVSEPIGGSAAVDRDAEEDDTAVETEATGRDREEDDAQGGRDTRHDNGFRDAEIGDGADRWGTGIDSAVFNPPVEYQACGMTYCPPGSVCCESCQVCMPPGSSCPQDCWEWIEPQMVPCSPFECGAPPGRAMMACPIGMIGGPFCMRTDNGTCAWQFVPCVSLMMSCGESVGYMCTSFEYCDAPDCGEGMNTGFCQIRPTGCQYDHEPVCGCDGYEYGNSCLAQMAGTNVAYEGYCR